MPGKFISESLSPVQDAGHLGEVRVGEPALPRAFRWRKIDLVLTDVLETWKELGPCTHGSGERYLRKHWFRARTADGAEATLYFERKSRSLKDRKRRWWLYTLSDGEDTIPEGESGD